MNETFYQAKIQLYPILNKTFPKINTKLIQEGGRKEIREGRKKIKGGEKRNKERKEIKGIRK